MRHGRTRAQNPACPGGAIRVPVPFVSLLPPTPQARFAAIVELLCRAVAARIAGGRLAGPLIVLICRRLRRLGARFADLAARHAAGTLPAPRRRPHPRRPPAARPRPTQPPLPRGMTWLVRLVPETASGASQLQHLLADAEMASLIAAAPQTGRILRPLCRMLGLRPPAALRLPPRPRPPAVPRRAASRRPSGSGTAPTAAPRPRRPAPAPAPALPPRACGPPEGAG